jgi:ribulose 1,5-bisphosphate carboxylase large subunit-like protein
VSLFLKPYLLYKYFSIGGPNQAMAPEQSQDELVLESLQALGVAFLPEWDALTFVYQHGTSVCTAAQIARLIGYDKTETGAAVQTLEVWGFIKRSRATGGTRFYQLLEPADPVRHRCLMDLMSLAQRRAGRLLLLRHLKRSGYEARRRRSNGLCLA